MKLKDLIAALCVFNEEYPEYDVEIESNSPTLDEMEIYLSPPDKTIKIMVKKTNEFRKKT